MVASGVVQGVGLAGVVASFFVPNGTSLGPLDAIFVGSTRVQLAPVAFGRSGAGLGAAAQF
jgi:hypothetical protein